MSRIVSTEGPGKIRSQHRRTIAEALRRLSQKPRLDEEAQDLAALIVICLHRIADTGRVSFEGAGEVTQFLCYNHVCSTPP